MNASPASSVVFVGDSAALGPLPAACQKHRLQLAHVPSVEGAVEAAGTGAAMLFMADGPALPQLMKILKENKCSTPVVAIGPAAPALNAAKAIRLGAIEYLTTPVDEKLLEALLAKAAPAAGAPPQAEQTPIHGDPATAALISQARQFAASDATILLRGESGCGKEVFSRFIHTQSPRANGPFVAVNCAAIPENLLESELFGHEKGAFSGALGKRIGKFQQAHGGTLLLDEISEMDLSLQAKLLRAIQEKIIDPIGAEKPVPVDIRLIATTNRKLEDYVAEGHFREDLYFRLSVIALDLPPLRERAGDIAPLSQFFLHKFASQRGRTTPLCLSPDALEKLEHCYWKGNVRELENTLHRAVLMVPEGEETLQAAHITLSPMSLKYMDEAANNTQAEQSVRPHTAHSAPLSAAARHYAAAQSGYKQAAGSAAPAQAVPPQTLQQMELEHILSTLTYCRGNREHAADILGISVQILKQKLAALSE